MIERIPKSVLIAGAVLTVTALAFMAYARPWYFTDPTQMVELVGLELLVVAVWMYRRLFLPVVLVSFLFAGSNLPVGHGWTAARWVVLGIAALVGALILVRERLYRFGLFHVLALFAVLTASISAAVSLYPDVALLKVLSMLLLFVYAATGVRVAAIGREEHFFRGLLIGCEIFVAANAVFYAVGIAAMGNPNSLGAVMGVVGAPILCWGVLQGGKPWVYRRRLFLFAMSIYLVFLSHARAGIGAALISSALLCIVLRKYKLLMQGATLLVMVLAAVGLLRPTAISSLPTSVVYKNKTGSILASRISPWETTMDNIREHPWFGMGLGTTASDTDASEQHGTFASTETVTAEHGSSYLAILSGVGMIGIIPFALLLLLLVSRIVRTFMLVQGPTDAPLPALVLATVIVAGLLHAGFEDWMFAPGNYLCVFFWAVAFLFNDFAPASKQFGLSLNSWHSRGTIGHAASGS